MDAANLRKATELFGEIQKLKLNREIFRERETSPICVAVYHDSMGSGYNTGTPSRVRYGETELTELREAIIAAIDARIAARVAELNAMGVQVTEPPAWQQTHGIPF